MSRQRIVAGLIASSAVVAVTIRLLAVDDAMVHLFLLGFLLVGPGGAIAFLVRPTSVGDWALVTLVGSLATVTLVALVLIYAHDWSVDVGVSVIAAITLVVIASRRRQAGTPSAMESGRANRTSSTEHPA